MQSEAKLTSAPKRFGIRANLSQFALQLFQVLLAGLAVGMTRNVIPALAHSEFGVPARSFMLLAAFVVAFGLVKGAMNFVAGRLSERMGRKHVQLIGWLFAVPIPPLIYYAPNWSWIVCAMILLGVNQGLAWSMTQTSKIDLTRPDQRGLVIGLSEFSGYLGVALAGVGTGYLATALGARTGLLWFGGAIIGLGTLLAWLSVVDTLPWAHAEARHQPEQTLRPKFPTSVGTRATTAQLFALMSWRDRRMVALSQAGMVEKFVDALVWVFWPLYLHERGVDLPGIGWIVGMYGFTWGIAQLFTGKMSDHLGRHWLNVLGMWICGAGVALMPLGDGVLWWGGCAVVAGLGMAMLYPNLLAAVSDISHPQWRASAIGIYRFWRDIGYAIGGIGLGLTATTLGGMQSAFWFVAGAMALSGLALHIWGEETHPRLNPEE